MCRRSKNEDNDTSISFNGIAVKKITKVNNGYVYEMEDYVEILNHYMS
mgnify:CR=1 FL=1